MLAALMVVGLHPPVVGGLDAGRWLLGVVAVPVGVDPAMEVSLLMALVIAFMAVRIICPSVVGGLVLLGLPGVVALLAEPQYVAEGSVAVSAAKVQLALLWE
jgi:hypothetical protein